MNEGGEERRVKMGEKIDVSEEPEENNGWRTRWQAAGTEE